MRAVWCRAVTNRPASSCSESTVKQFAGLFGGTNARQIQHNIDCDSTRWQSEALARIGLH